MSKVPAVLDLLGKGMAYHYIAARVGVTESYARAVRSRFTARDAVTFWRRSKATKIKTRHGSRAPGLALPVVGRTRFGYRYQPTGQSQKELRELAMILYNMRHVPRLRV